MLRPSRPMMRPFISSEGSCTVLTVISAVWSLMTRWMAVTTTSRALSSASSRALRSMERASRTASCSASSRTCLEEDLLGLVRAHLADLLEGRHLLLARLGQLLALGLELALAVEQLAVALLEHVGALVELLVTLQQAPFEARQLAALGACLLLGLALQADLLVLGLEDQLLLLRSRLGDDASGLLLGVLDGLAAPHATRHEADAEAGCQRHEHRGGGNQGIHLSLPSGLHGRRYDKSVMRASAAAGAGATPWRASPRRAARSQAPRGPRAERPGRCPVGRPSSSGGEAYARPENRVKRPHGVGGSRPRVRNRRGRAPRARRRRCRPDR